MSGDQPRSPAGAPTGGQFAATVRPEPATALTGPRDPGRFGPHGVHVQRLLDRVANLTDGERERLVAHSPAVLGAEQSGVFCPAGDATHFVDLPRYRDVTRNPEGTRRLRGLSGALGEALRAAAEVTRGLPEPSREAVCDAACALVARGRIHAIAYETLTRAVRQTVGRIHPEDGPLHR